MTVAPVLYPKNMDRITEAKAAAFDELMTFYGRLAEVIDLPDQALQAASPSVLLSGVPKVGQRFFDEQMKDEIDA